MKKNIRNTTHWQACSECKGRGKKTKRLTKKSRLAYQRKLATYKSNKQEGAPPVRPKGHKYDCKKCGGSGLETATAFLEADIKNYPHLAIIGGGIGGTALAVACLHCGIPFTLYEQDISFDARAQGYGLTLQQASKAMKGFGIPNLEDGIVSTRHVVHNTDGTIVGEWGMRKWLRENKKTAAKKTNVHIARQGLRSALLNQLSENESVQWGHRLLSFDTANGGPVQLKFDANGKIKNCRADLVVGADGIRSVVRSNLFINDTYPLRYLNCIVILGICSYDALQKTKNPLLDHATVFQTANGTERIYVMPFSDSAIMWQLSFPLAEDEAKKLSALGPGALKKEACKRTQWHSPIPEIMQATNENLISGYPVYDRALLSPNAFDKAGALTLIGDAAHPMSPFKGQGANQALLDALSLARTIAHACRPKSNWRKTGIRESALKMFEKEMLDRSSSKVKDSAAAAQFLHSDIVLHKGDAPRGRFFKK